MAKTSVKDRRHCRGCVGTLRNCLGATHCAQNLDAELLNQPNVQEGLCLMARRLRMHELEDVGWSVLKITHFVGPLVPSNFVDCFT